MTLGQLTKKLDYLNEMGAYVADDQIEYQYISNKIKKEVERVVQIFSLKDRSTKPVRERTLTILSCE